MSDLILQTRITWNLMLIMSSIRNLLSPISLLYISIPEAYQRILIPYLPNLDHSFSVIAITETCGNEYNDQFLRLNGYYRVCRHRPVGRGSGVSLFIKDDYTILYRPDLDVHLNDKF